MKFLNENSMSRVLINKLTESVESTDSVNIIDKLKAAQNLEELENMLKDIVKDDKEFGLSVFGEINQGEADGKSFEDIKNKVIEEVTFKINNPDKYNMKSNDFNESKDLKEDAWDDNFVISALQNDKVYWKRKSDGKEIVTSFDVFTEPTDPTEWKSEEELSQYALEEDLGPAQKVYNKKILNNRKQVNTAKNSATNLNEETEEKRIARYGESGGSVLRGGWKEMSNEEAEDLAKEASIENPNDVFYVEYNDLMNSSSDIRWYKGKSYTPEEIQDIRRKEKEAIYKNIVD